MGVVNIKGSIIISYKYKNSTELFLNFAKENYANKQVLYFNISRGFKFFNQTKHIHQNYEICVATK